MNETATSLTAADYEAYYHYVSTMNLLMDCWHQANADGKEKITRIRQCLTDEMCANKGCNNGDRTQEAQ